MSLFKMSVKSILTFSILIFSLFLFTQNSIAVTFTVTNLNDSGDGSLRAAIIASNTSAGVDDEIVFMVGLTGAIPTDAGADNVFSEEMAITEDVTITGPGANAITIDAQMVDRIFNIDDGSDPDIVVSISGLRLINGLADSGGIGNLGGAIYNAEELSIDSCVFEKNSANSFGGAIFNDGTITEITNCTFTENSADDRDGGAIFNNNVGLITKIADSNFTGNSAKEWGGAISNFKTITEITNSNFTENSAGVDGGAIDNRSIITEITDSNFTENSAEDDGGAIHNNGDTITKITNSTFTGNSTERDGGAIFGGADFRGSPTIIEITNCTFSGNSAHDDGGAIYNQTGTITITNCTFTGNSAGDDGGAIYNQTGNTNISFTTIANNEADEGGGIFSTEATTNIRNSIVAFNTAATPGENCNVDIADENSNETNNYSNDDSCGFGLGGDDTEIKQDPLADNGGFTETHALLEGDPVDGASPDCRRIGSDGTPTETALANDQRDFPRPSGPACDSGAYEAQLSALVEAPGAYEVSVSLFSFFDLRDRESFVQLTSIDTIDGTVHVQIFNVSNNCSENNFFDTYTPNDTHVYNMRDIQTNNGNPSGVILPDGAYGFVSIVPVNPLSIIGNFRVIDNNGYEYRTNSVNLQNVGLGFFTESATFNFNTKGNITLSDVVGLTFDFDFEEGEVSATDILDNFVPVDINIVNENEVIFSCRNVVFACTDQDNPLLEALLEEAGVASVASFEYGINNAIPHSKGSELLCPGNTISDGVVTIDRIQAGDSQDIGFIGLNNGNGRGSMDSWWYPNMELLQPPPPG